MPKSQYISPEELRRPRFIEFGKIPVNQYRKSIEEEKQNFSSEDFIRIYHDMVIIREFLLDRAISYGHKYFHVLILLLLVHNLQYVCVLHCFFQLNYYKLMHLWVFYY